MRIRTLLAASVIAVALTGCTSFEVTFPDGPGVKSSGAVLLSRDDNFEITHEWLDGQTNILHKVTVKRLTNENASSQLEALKYAFSAGQAAAGKVPKAP